jgi:hypothetical protein
MSSDPLQVLMVVAALGWVGAAIALAVFALTSRRRGTRPTDPPADLDAVSRRLRRDLAGRDRAEGPEETQTPRPRGIRRPGA